jgi:hypothetical protein
MSALQKKYFGKGHGKIKKNKVVNVARRKRSYRGFAKRTYSRARGLGGGKFGQFIPPVVGGLADELLVNFNVFGFKLPNGVGSAAIGHFMHEPITRNIGLYQVGRSLPGYFGMGSSGGGSVISQV